MWKAAHPMQLILMMQAHNQREEVGKCNGAGEKSCLFRGKSSLEEKEARMTMAAAEKTSIPQRKKQNLPIKSILNGSSIYTDWPQRRVLYFTSRTMTLCIQRPLKSQWHHSIHGSESYPHLQSNFIMDAVYYRQGRSP